MIKKKSIIVNWAPIIFSIFFFSLIMTGVVLFHLLKIKPDRAGNLVSLMFIIPAIILFFLAIILKIIEIKTGFVFIEKEKIYLP